jgi:hypothetical protein
MTARDIHELLTALMEDVADRNPEHDRSEYTKGFLDCAAHILGEVEDQWGDELE